MLTKGAAVTTAGKARQQSQQTSPLLSQFLRVGSHDWVSGTNEAVVKQFSRGHLYDIFEILNSLHQVEPILQTKEDNIYYVCTKGIVLGMRTRMHLDTVIS